MTSSSSLDMPETEPCAFCQYLRRERPYTILEEGDLVAMLVTREQRGIGHLLVIPVAHRKSILDLTEQESSALMRAIRRAAAAIDSGFERPGIAVWQNNGLPAHQTIPHMHFHVAGTRLGGGTDFGKVRELSIEETDAIGAVLQPHLRTDP